MLQQVWEFFRALLGLELEVGAVSPLQMVVRTVAVYAFTLLIVRLGSKRFLAEATAFDVIVGIMLGSVMSRAINGSAPFVPTLLAGVALVAFHWLLGILSYRFDWFGPQIKGNPVLLIRDGVVQEEGMRKGGLSTMDLEQALRTEAKLTDPARVRLACLERNGGISVIPFKPEPLVFTVSVADGVQTVRIELDGEA
jgi:uncharacterized membrane protein YcaP (DUF421 family)